MSKNLLPRKKEIYYQILHFSTLTLGHIRFLYTSIFVSFSVILSYLKSNSEQTSITLCPSRNLPLHYVFASCQISSVFSPSPTIYVFLYDLSPTFKDQISLTFFHFPFIHVQNVTEYTKCTQADNTYLLS
jgi:hypothetical protein